MWPFCCLLGLKCRFTLALEISVKPDRPYPSQQNLIRLCEQA